MGSFLPPEEPIKKPIANIQPPQAPKASNILPEKQGSNKEQLGESVDSLASRKRRQGTRGPVRSLIGDSSGRKTLLGD